MEMHTDKDKEEIIQEFRADKIIQGTQMINIDRMSKSMLNQLMRIFTKTQNYLLEKYLTLVLLVRLQLMLVDQLESFSM
jgi:hypothetical protein